jgi:hypothetical protein
VSRADRPLCVLLLPAPLERFILRDQAEDLLRAPGVVAAEPGRLPAGALARLPPALAAPVARRLARRLVSRLRATAGEPRVLVIFHAVQHELARAVLAEVPGCELWYWRWDRYEVAYDASARMRRRLDDLHRRAAEQATLVPAVSHELVRLEREAGRDAELVALSADGFPAPEGGSVVAICLGHIGRRIDWRLVRAVAQELGDELVLLLAGTLHEGECAHDPDFAACRALTNLVWLGSLGDEIVARLVLCADVGVLPFKTEPFNDAALPYRILKCARLGRRTITPSLAGVRTWAQAVVVAGDSAAFVAALREHAGARMRPDKGLRAWALAQTAQAQNAPLWARLEAAGVDVGDQPQAT